MSSKIAKLLLGGAVMAAMPATQAFAAGTEAGTAVTNTFTMTYTVDGDQQTLVNDPDDSVTFAVDRVVDLTVAVDNAAITASPNGTVTQIFSVTNTGNSTQAYDLDFFQQADGTAPENFDLVEGAPFTVTIRIDLDGDGFFTGAGETVTYTPDENGIVPSPDVAPDQIMFVDVVTTIPAGQADASVATVALEANTLEPANRPLSGVVIDGATGREVPGTGTAIGGASGTEVGASTDPNGAGTVETVLADNTGTGAGVTGVTDTDNDGDHSAVSVVTIQSATIAAAKSVSLVSQDGTGCALANPAVALPAAANTQDYIPGACVQYVIDIENTGSATATSIALEDILQVGSLTYVDAGISGAVGGTVSTVPATCTAATTCTVNLAGGELETNETGQLIILATIK